MNVPETFPHSRITNVHSVLLWDGECGFCARSVTWLHRHGRRPVSTQAFQSLLSELPQEVLATARDQVLWIAASGEVVGGSLAVIAALQAAGRPGWAALLRALQPFTRWGYRLVARNRARLGRSICGTG